VKPLEGGIRKTFALTMRWILWSEVLGPVIVIGLAIPGIVVLEPMREAVTLVGTIAGAIMFAAWGVVFFFVRIPSLILAALILAVLSQVRPALEASVVVSTCVVALISFVAAKLSYALISSGSHGDVPFMSWLVWIGAYLVGPRLAIASIRPGAFGDALRIREGYDANAVRFS